KSPVATLRTVSDISALPGVAPCRATWSANKNGMAAPTSCMNSHAGSSSSGSPSRASTIAVEIWFNPFCAKSMSPISIAHPPRSASTPTAMMRDESVAGAKRTRSKRATSPRGRPRLGDRGGGRSDFRREREPHVLVDEPDLLDVLASELLDEAVDQLADEDF